MITFEQAYKIARQHRIDTMGDEGIIDAASDCGDRWAFSFVADSKIQAYDINDYPGVDEELIRSLNSPTGSAPMFVFKEDGKVEYFLVTEYLDLFEKAIPIEVPRDIED